MIEFDAFFYFIGGVIVLMLLLLWYASWIGRKVEKYDREIFKQTEEFVS